MESSHVIYAMLGANVLYFLSAPMMRLIGAPDPFDATALERQRRVALEYLGLALFTDRVHGARLAERVLTEMPMPQFIAAPDDPLCIVESSNRKSEADINVTSAPRNLASEVRHK
jgi:hypothetical protein